MTGNCGVVFRILTFFRKWIFYHSYQNIKDFHLKMIRDAGTDYHDDDYDKNDKKEKGDQMSIWSKPGVDRKRKNNFDNKVYIRLRKSLKSVFIRLGK